MKDITITTNKEDLYENSIELGNIDGYLYSIKEINQTLQPEEKIEGQIISKLYLLKGAIVIQNKRITGLLNFSSSIEGQIKIPLSQNYEFYSESFEITPSFLKQVLNTQNKIMKENVQVNEIQTYEVSNDSGTTFII